MKQFCFTYGLLALGAVIGNLLYVKTLGNSNDYHWPMTYIFTVFLGVALAIFRKYRKKIA